MRQNFWIFGSSVGEWLGYGLTNLGVRF